jgi:sigma-B regulation protein RsbU (phosphoserine phosphatase)
MLRPEKTTRTELSSHNLLQEKPLEDQLSLKDRALAASAEGITIADATKPDCPLIYVNKGFEQLTGYSAEYTCGTNCRFLQGKDTDPIAVEEIRRALQEKRDCVVEILNYRKDGEPFWNRLSITPIRDDAGVVTHFVGIQSDVTARRRAEDALTAAKTELEQANRLIQNDLQAAAKIQNSLLPAPSPNLEGATAAWQLIPCDELAGDTLNAVRLDSRYNVFYVVDVSGHGVQASLLSVSLNHWLSNKSNQIVTSGYASGRPDERSALSPKEVLERLNRQFPLDPETGQYFTIVYAVLDTLTNECCLATAGHPAAVYSPSGGPPVLVQSDNFPIGIVPNPEFRENSVKMNPGDRMYFYSDGLVEATNAGGERFESQRLLEGLFTAKTLSLEESVSDFITRLKEWSGKTSFEDDVSLLGFEIK